MTSLKNQLAISHLAARKRLVALAAALAVVAALTASGAPAALAASGGGRSSLTPAMTTHQVAPSTITDYSCLNNPSNANCEGKDPAATGCNNGAYVLGGDASDTQVLWSPNCSSNYAYLVAPSGYSQVYQVFFWRTPYGSLYTRNYCNTHGCPVAKTLYYCEQGDPLCNSSNSNWSNFHGYIQPGWRTFETDLLYAPNAAVQVCVTFLTSSGQPDNTCSSWH